MVMSPKFLQFTLECIESVAFLICPKVGMGLVATSSKWQRQSRLPPGPTLHYAASLSRQLLCILFTCLISHAKPAAPQEWEAPPTQQCLHIEGA